MLCHPLQSTSTKSAAEPTTAQVIFLQSCLSAMLNVSNSAA